MATKESKTYPPSRVVLRHPRYGNISVDVIAYLPNGSVQTTRNVYPVSWIVSEADSTDIDNKPSVEGTDDVSTTNDVQDSLAGNTGE